MWGLHSASLVVKYPHSQSSNSQFLRDTCAVRVVLSNSLIRLWSGSMWAEMTNKSHLRIAVDGCYRVVREGYALFSLGLLTKGPEWKCAARDIFTTTFNECIIAVVNSEKKECCLRVFAAWERAMEVCLGVQDARHLVDQCHSDQHKGIRAASKDFFDSATMVLDFSHGPGPPPPLPKTIASDDRWQATKVQCFCVCRGTWTLLSPPAQDYSFRWQALKVQCFCVCVQRNMNAFVPPRPCPRHMFRVHCVRWQAIKVQCFCVCRGTWTLLSPPRPCPRLLLEMTGDQGAVLLCVQRNMNAFVPPPCPRLLLQMTGDQGAVLLCVQRNMNAFVPRPPCPRLIQGAHGQMTGDEGAVQGAMLQGVLLASVWLRPMCVYGWVRFVCADELYLCAWRS